MNALRPLMMFGAIGLAGCASVPLPPEAAALVLIPVPSQSVAIYQPKLVTKDGRLMLDGWVYRKYGAWTTAQSHLDIVFLDASGRERHSELTYFVPRDLPAGGGHRMRPRGHYTLLIPAMPPGTTRIEVRAHDGQHDEPNVRSNGAHATPCQAKLISHLSTRLIANLKS